jgi:protocatechuate 3,4-dioxygenase beta subunit
MKRNEFLKRSFRTLGAISILPTFAGCRQNDEDVSPDGDGECVLTASETEGPYPTNKPASFEMEDITGDRDGTPLSVEIIIQNRNNDCAPLPDVSVDIWHCDSAGNYSQYGSYSGANFLRGRQTSDQDGTVRFATIYPGWYRGRAVHIHVHVFDSAGKSLLVTQIAFPEDITAVVLGQGVYASHGQPDTRNAQDNIFRDSIATEMSTVTGNVANGYKLTHAIVVNG